MYYIIAYPETINHLNYNTVRGFHRSFLLDSVDVRRACAEAHNLPFQRWSAARASSVCRSRPSQHCRRQSAPRWSPRDGHEFHAATCRTRARGPRSNLIGQRPRQASIRSHQGRATHPTRASTSSAHVQNVCLQKAFCPQLFALSSTSAMIAEPIASLWKAFLSSVVRPLPLPLWKRKGGRGKVRGATVREPTCTNTSDYCSARVVPTCRRMRAFGLCS